MQLAEWGRFTDRSSKWGINYIGGKGTDIFSAVYVAVGGKNLRSFCRLPSEGFGGVKSVI